MKQVNIVCPVFREQDGIAAFHQRLSNVLCALDQYAFRILYVLDPFPDQTEHELVKLAQADNRVGVLVMSRRFGHQAALLAGMDASKGDAVVMLDSDLQHPPELIPALLARWELGADIVQGQRIDGDETRYLKRQTSRLFYAAFTGAANFKIETGAADYRLLSRRVVDVLSRGLQERNAFLRGLISWVGFQVDYVPFKPDNRYAGQSSYGVSKLVGFAINGICSFSKLPLRICAISGVFLALLSFIIGLLQIGTYALGNSYVPGWASLIVLIVFFGGVQLFFIGVIGEYVGLIFDEVKARPRYIISHTYSTSEETSDPAPVIRTLVSFGEPILKQRVTS